MMLPCCCGFCDTGFETGDFTDNFATQDSGWTGFENDAGWNTTNWNSLFDWNSGKVKGRFIGSEWYPSPGYPHPSNHWVRRKTAIEFQHGFVAPPPGPIIDLAIDVRLERPLPGIPVFPFGYGHGSTGLVGIVGPDSTKIVPATYPILGTKGNQLWHNGIGWSSGYKLFDSPGSPAGPFEQVILAVNGPQVATWTNHSTFPFSLETASTSKNRLGYLILFNALPMTGAAGQWPVNQQTWRIRLTVQYTATTTSAKYYLDGQHLLTCTTGTVGGSWCSSSPYFGFWRDGPRPSVFSSFPIAGAEQVNVEFDNWEQHLYVQ